MKADLMEKMLDAGFTKEEIFRIIEEPAATGGDTASAPAQEPDTKTAAAPAQEPDTKTATAPAQEPEKKTAAAPVQEPEKKTADETEKRLAGIEKSISDLIKSIQAENIKRDSFGGTPDSLEEQTDRIMASIIRPETAKRKDD